jgi:hypothetical protein
MHRRTMLFEHLYCHIIIVYFILLSVSTHVLVLVLDYRDTSCICCLQAVAIVHFAIMSSNYPKDVAIGPLNDNFKFFVANLSFEMTPQDVKGFFAVRLCVCAHLKINYNGACHSLPFH